MTLRDAGIFTKVAGPAVGLLLVMYGAVSLWLGRSTTAETKQRFCEVWLCAPLRVDSPAAITAPAAVSLTQAREELDLDPASAYRWADLADSEINANQVDAGKFCVRQALADAPGSPAILFRAARFYLRLEDYPETLRQLMSVLRNPDLATYYDQVFSLYSQMDLPLEDLLNQGLPRTPGAANAFLRFWVNQNRLDEAEQTWAWINRNSLTSLQSAGSYVAMLAKAGRWDEAMSSWKSYTGRRDPTYRLTNWVYDGSFEMTPVDSPFDWKLTPREWVQVGLDTEAGYTGSSSLRLRFEDTPKDGAPEAYQTVLLTPGKWQIRAALKTQGLTGRQGVVVRVVDADDATRLDVATNTLTGTQEWTPVSKGFEVGAATKRVRVEVVRPIAQDLDVKVQGVVWVDAVVLTPAT